ncbi:MAG: hypothetical protein HUK14_05675 [Muribaculaceae bacterium]|nr:hypothetical protein [Muribaculaceae bacterium]
MQLTQRQKDIIDRKEAALDDALRRQPLKDYFEGWYHVTLNTRGEAPTCGYVVGDAEAADGSADAPRVVLTEVGKGVDNVWKSVHDFHPCATVEAWVVMPEHTHALIRMQQLPGCKREHLGQVINGFMIACTHAYWDALGIDWRNMPDRDEGGRKGADGRGAPRKYTDALHMRSFRGPALFVRGYNDVEALTPEQVEIKRQYIRNNPRKRLIAQSRPDRFRINRNCRSTGWTMERTMDAIAADRWIGRYPEKCRRLQENIRARLNPGMTIDYLGNRDLLAAERKVSLICHRDDLPLFEQQKQAVLQAAREGAVVVSAFISPRERDIMKQLMAEQLPFVQLMDNGFADRYRPAGKAFYSVAENRHVQLSCWTYSYQPADAGKPLSREMCLVMNELARLISGVDDRWWQ